MKVDPSIFKAYDIRGIYPTQLNEDIAYQIACAYSSILKQENKGKKLCVVVGSDMRVSSPMLKKSVIEGLLFSGIDVIDVGLVSTPTFYFAVAYFGYDGGIQVSASHNPKEYNGLKMTRKRAVALSFKTGIERIKDMLVNGFDTSPGEKGILSRLRNVEKIEVREQTKGINIKKIKPFKIVTDTANGMGIKDIKAMFAPLPCRLIKLNSKLDGTFPSHPPDPLRDENLLELKEAVVKNKADLGIAPDGDGDRYFFVDEKGETVPQPILRGLMAQIELKDRPNSTVCYDIRPGRITQEMIEEAGGKAVVTPVGHSLIKEKMLEVGAIFGGESSGHYFYKLDYGTFEAPVILVYKFLVYLSESGKTLSSLIAPYKKYFHTGEINYEVERKEEKLKEIARAYSHCRLNFLDGVSVDCGDFWFNVRPSNTEPLLRFQLEAVSYKLMEEKKNEIEKIIKS